MFPPRAGSRPRVKRAGQKIYLGSEEREGELEPLPRSLLWLPDVGEGQRRGRPLSPHPNTSPWVLVLKGGNQMRSAPGSRDLKQAWLGVTRTNWKPARNTLPTPGGQGIGDQGCLPWGCRCVLALCADALGHRCGPAMRTRWVR